MKHIIPVLLAAILFSACGKKEDSIAKLTRLKKERSDMDVEIRKLEASTGAKDSVKSVAVSILSVQPQRFESYIDVQAAVVGDENILATPQAAGIVKQLLVRTGQHVGKGQTLAVLDASAVDQQVAQQDAQITMLRASYEKQQKLWAQNIGSEMQLITAKANYESAMKQRAMYVAQRNMYRIVAPISGTVDEVHLKEGDVASPGTQSGLGIRIVNANKLKAEAKLGEGYLGKVRVGDPVKLIFTDLNDSMNTHLTFVAQAVDPVSRSFTVQIALGSMAKLHPNMSARMKISNYSSNNALVIPVAAIQKTGEGDMVFVAAGKQAKAIPVQTGRNSNGLVEILGGLNSGDKVVVAGYEDLDNGTAIVVQ